MTNLLTQCPFCQTSFKVTEDQMQAANGVVRCGVCMEVFLAVQHRIILKDKASDGSTSEAFQDHAITEDTISDNVEANSSEEDESPASLNQFDDLEKNDTEENKTDLPEEELEEALEEELKSEFNGENENLKTTEQTKPSHFSAFLNPFGYKIQQLSVDYNLPEPANDSDLAAIDSQEFNAQIADDEDVENDETVEKDSDHAESTIPSAVTESSFLNINILEDATEQEADNTWGEDPQFVYENKVQNTDEDKNTIPTFTPDLVAREDIPVNQDKPDTAWFQPLRNTSQSDIGSKGNYSTTDEKAIIHNNISSLVDDDKLAPLAQENLDAIDDEPIELLEFLDPLKSLKTAGLLLTTVLFITTLAGQYVWFNPESLLQDERFEPITTQLCKLVDCPDSTQIGLTTLITDELVIRSHTSVEDALQVDFIFRNKTSREQRFPLVELNFTNNNGSTVANRLFIPTEYLPSEMHLFTHMPAHSSIQASMELMDPGVDATGYSLVFRNL